jgi:diguanylate cyclase (GGDEF)-like protein/PAS domain S-box-containing protein
MQENEHDYRSLQDSEALMQAFMRHSPVVAFMKDAEGRYVYANERLSSLFQVTLDFLRGKTDFDWLPEKVAQQIRENDQMVLLTGQTIELLETIPTPDGISRYWMVLKFPFTKVDGQKFVGGIAVDITRRIEAEERLAESERRYRHLTESSLGLICSHDLNGYLLSINPAAVRTLGYEASEMIGKDMREFVMPPLRQHFDRYLERVRQNGSDDGLMLLLTKDGQTRTWKYHNTLFSEEGKPDYVLGHAQDVTELKREQETARRLSFTDDLTGLYNRRGFLMLAEQQLKLARRQRTEKSLLLVYADMDGLKQINDRFGHQEGSLAIIKTAEIFRQVFRESDVIARLGGDEFVVLMLNATDESSEAMPVRLQEKLREYNAQNNNRFNLALSVGTRAIDSEGAIPLEEMLAKADAAMYKQKRRKESQS